MTAPARHVAVVVPVHNGARHLDHCLSTLIPQVAAAGGEIIVVDDASTDETRSIAARDGVRVLTTAGTGPYVARNVGWRATAASTVVFTDVRCRARAGWLEAMVTAVSTDGVAIAGADVVMRAGGTLAQRWAARDQVLRIGQHIEREFLPFVPTASLAVRRTTLEKLEGFRPVRSGGDVELCWRAQLEGLGAVVAAPGAAMDCVPRESLRAVLGQWRRYGAAHAHLWTEFAPHGCPLPRPEKPATAIRHGLRWAVRALLRERDAVEFVESLRYVVYQHGYRSGLAEVARGVPWGPTPEP